MSRVTETSVTRNGTAAHTNAPADPATETPATEQAARSAHETIDSLTETAAAAERKIREFGAKAETTVREKGERARTQADELIDQAKAYANEKPLAAAGIAFAAGLLISRFMSR